MNKREFYMAIEWTCALFDGAWEEYAVLPKIMTLEQAQELLAELKQTPREMDTQEYRLVYVAVEKTVMVLS